MASLTQKLVSVYEKIDHIEKRGKNTAQNYSYVRAADLAHAVRKALLELGVYAEVNFFTERTYQTLREGKSALQFTDVRCTISFHDETGQTITASGLGTGMDTGDKATYKAQTGALKYAIRNAFLVPDDADPEDDGGEDLKKSKPKTSKAKTSASTNATLPPKAEIPSEPLGAAQPSGEPVKPVTRALPEANSIPANAAEALPTEEQGAALRNNYSLLCKDLKDAGLESSKGKPIARKLALFIIYVCGVEPEKLTYSQWTKLFDLIRATNKKVLAAQIENISGGK